MSDLKNMRILIKDTTLSGIADAIRAKEGNTEPIPVPDMASRIIAIESGGVTLPSLTNQGSESDLRSGKQLIDSDGNVVRGNVDTRYNSSVVFKVDGESIVVNVPAGIYDSDIDKNIGTIKEATTYTPTTSDQTINANTYLTGVQTILGDENLNAANIKSGVSIFGVNGTLESGIDTSDATATASDMAYGVTAYVDGEKITGNITEIKSEQSTTADGTVYTGYDSKWKFGATYNFIGDRLYRKGSSISVGAPSSDFGNATAADVAAGKTFTSSAGLKVTGTMTSDGWEKVQFLLEGSGEASLSTDIYGNGVFYIDFASPISSFTGLSFIYEREDRSGYESYATSIIPGYSEGKYLGLYHNFDYGDEDEDGFIPSTYGDAVYDWGITASLTSSTRIKVDINEIGNYIEDAGSRHYGCGVVFVKYA